MQRQFDTFTATELYCPKCGRSQPVRERLLLVLPSGELHEFRCAHCATSLGKRTVTGPAVAPAPVTATPVAATQSPARDTGVPKPRKLLR